MKTKYLAATAALLVATVAFPAFAGDKKDKDKKKDKTEQWERIGAIQSAPTPSEPAGIPQPNYGLSTYERHVIREYCRAEAVTSPRGRTAHKLPPGIAKRIARADLPQNWQKKVCTGQVLPEPVLQECEPLPREILVRLPKPPIGTITVAVEGKVVRLMEATREIMDVFDLTKNL